MFVLKFCDFPEHACKVSTLHCVVESAYKLSIKIMMFAGQFEIVK